MDTTSVSPVIDQLRRAAILPNGAGLSDGQLLECYVSRGEEAAFEALMRRHGAMVLSVCRRILCNHHDAEDAFQATFLVLVHKAASIWPREMVANWLYGVAYRTALKARAITARRKRREKTVSQPVELAAMPADDRWHELRALLDRALNRLPDKYRIPVVLCDLEGKTGKEAAQQLGWPEGTVSSRLSRARALLTRRLARYGLTLTSGSLAALVSQKSASACVPGSLLISTIDAARLYSAGQVVAESVIPISVANLTKGMT
ncbi:MAG TPA: RNA polymerase sigma factor [Gemmataceae bacterium]|nr:RNA polymerase sigma factor [Gemmataceae bacterium]